MSMNAHDWAELEYLTGRVSELHSLHRAAMGGSVLRAVKREIEEREAQRQRLISRLSKHLASKVVDSLATAAWRE
jgi:hypothetical protein